MREQGHRREQQGTGAGRGRAGLWGKQVAESSAPGGRVTTGDLGTCGLPPTALGPGLSAKAVLLHGQGGSYGGQGEEKSIHPGSMAEAKRIQGSWGPGWVGTIRSPPRCCPHMVFYPCAQRL